MKDRIQAFKAGNIGALARILSWIEDDHPQASPCMEELFPLSGRARILGVTGPPGAGKSTLVNALATALVAEGKTVAILAVDPSSPFSGGAVLGDRIRMTHALQDAGVFIRSMATRGALGGLAPRAAEALFILDAFGFDYILLETVGVGQAEVDVVKLVDSVLLVLVPGMGDTVQALKAGILEIADLFLINKADHDGTDRLQKELRTLLSLAPNHVHPLASADSSEAANVSNIEPWDIPILRTVATKSQGIDEVLAKLKEHASWSEQSGYNELRRKQLLEQSFRKEILQQVESHVLGTAQASGNYQKLLREVLTRKVAPRKQAETLLSEEKWFKS